MRRQGLPQATLLVGVTFAEQGPTRDEERRTWLFAEVEKKRGYKPRIGRLLAAQALSAGERARRIPELDGLAQAHAIVIGAGSLGAPVALELAKAGAGRLDLFDNDLYDVNNTVRHVVPATYAGQAKAEAVADLCRGLNPFITVYSHAVAVGDSEDANALLTEALATAAVVIDTTGVQAVARFVEPQVRAVGRTLVVAGLTGGSFGADLFVVAPDGPCFDCFIASQEQGFIPTPPAGHRSAVTPIGCSHPAFVGAGFEATELAAITSRHAIQATGASGYPSTESNWAVLNFRGSPHHEEGTLEARPDCRCRR